MLTAFLRDLDIFFSNGTLVYINIQLSLKTVTSTRKIRIIGSICIECNNVASQDCLLVKINSVDISYVPSTGLFFLGGGFKFSSSRE